MKKVDVLLSASFIMLILVLGLWGLERQEVVQLAPPPLDVPSKVNIGNFFAIDASPDFVPGGNGIVFTGITDYPVNNIQALGNSLAGGGQTSGYWIQRSPTSNSDIEICVKVDTAQPGSGDLIEIGSGDTIPYLGETYEFIGSLGPGFPDEDPIGSISLTAGGIVASPFLTSGTDTVSYNFWLDVPLGPFTTGDYVNSLIFEATLANNDCTS